MPAIVFDLIVLVGLLYLAWLGSAMGLYVISCRVARVQR
jgi:threonine/homoserine/homoserine lactone efflux protein